MKRLSKVKGKHHIESHNKQSVAIWAKIANYYYCIL